MAFKVIDDKLKTKIIFALECGAEIKALAREFGVSVSTLRRWKLDLQEEQ